MPIKRQAIIYTNDDLDYWHINVSLDLDVLTQTFLLMMQVIDLISWISCRITNITAFFTRYISWHGGINTLRPRQNGRHFADDTFKRIFFNENIRILIKISLKFVPKGPINNNPTLVQIMAWRRSGDKPLSEPMKVSLLTHICVTRPQWVNTHIQCRCWYMQRSCRVGAMGQDKIKN